MATNDIAVLEIDFCNPAQSPDHCPPQATLVHRLKNGRSHELRVHYPGENSQHDRTGLS